MSALLIVFIAALVPMVMGFIWYNPKVFGTAWMQASGLTPETAMKGFNMPLIMGISLFVSFLLAFSLNPMVIHQYGFFSMIATPEGQKELADHTSATYGHAKALFDEFGGSFRSFKHGMLHGAILAIFTIMPVLVTGSLFERKGWKYIAINVGYWIVCLTIMGGIICQFMPHTGIFPVNL